MGVAFNIGVIPRKPTGGTKDDIDVNDTGVTLVKTETHTTDRNLRNKFVYLRTTLPAISLTDSE